jgi:hypothetical protein
VSEKNLLPGEVPVHSEILYQIAKNRLADLREDAADRRTVRQAMATRRKEHGTERWSLRGPLGKRQRS